MSDFRNLMILYLTLVALISLSSITYAQKQPPTWGCRLDGWECVGKVRLVVRKALSKDAVGTYVFSSFSNGDLLFEDFSNAKTMKFFPRPREHQNLFFGVTRREEAEGLERRFQRAGRLAFETLLTMASVFPEGENTFPDRWQTRRVEQQGLVSDISGKQAGFNKFLFRVQNRYFDVEGEWDITKQEPWPDSESMAGWTVWGGSPSPTLGQIRAVTRK